ncbi:hypothetical protein MOMA_06961 [Moraxella macacae 0408225]|uniref:Uncharacterized protein n=1 Tax=Moraxella macacae 0408225 TaxID=1230338 RepID=L2F5H9_9GAMM|nr:hypothetical protein MOMA_06961 [Moraxella macacae 0408225]
MKKTKTSQFLVNLIKFILFIGLVVVFVALLFTLLKLLAIIIPVGFAIFLIWYFTFGKNIE